METRQISAAELLIEQLKSEGWKVQREGVVYLNGTLGTNLYKDGEVLHISQEFYPDEELIEDLWPEEKLAAGREVTP